MILTESPVQFDDHPLAGLSPEQREEVRVQAFGRVLAAIAIRKMGPERQDPTLAGGQPEDRRLPGNGRGFEEVHERWT